MAILPNSGCQSFKAKLYRWAGVKVGSGVEFFQGIKVQGIGELEIQDRAFIGHEVLFMLNEGSKINVEESAIVGSRSVVMTGFHPITPDGERILSSSSTPSRSASSSSVFISLSIYASLSPSSSPSDTRTYLIPLSCVSSSTANSNQDNTNNSELGIVNCELKSWPRLCQSSRLIHSPQG